MVFSRFAVAAVMQKMDGWSFTSLGVTISRANTLPARRTGLKETSGRQEETRMT